MIEKDRLVLQRLVRAIEAWRESREHLVWPVRTQLVQAQQDELDAALGEAWRSLTEE